MCSHALTEEGLRWIEKKAKTKFGDYIVEELRGRSCCFLDNIIVPHGKESIKTLSKADLNKRFGKVKHTKKIFPTDKFREWVGARYAHMDILNNVNIDFQGLQSHLEQHLIDLCEMAEVFRKTAKYNVLFLASKGIVNEEVAKKMTRALPLSPTHLNGAFEVMELKRE